MAVGLPDEAAQVVDQVGAANGERRDQYVTALSVGLLQDVRQLFQGFVAGAVIAVAIGRLHQQYIGLVQLRGGLHQR